MVIATAMGACPTDRLSLEVSLTLPLHFRYITMLSIVLTWFAAADCTVASEVAQT